MKETEDRIIAFYFVFESSLSIVFFFYFSKSFLPLFHVFDFLLFFFFFFMVAKKIFKFFWPQPSHESVAKYYDSGSPTTHNFFIPGLWLLFVCRAGTFRCLDSCWFSGFFFGLGGGGVLVKDRKKKRQNRKKKKKKKKK